MQCLPNTFPILIDVFETFLGFLEELLTSQCCPKHYHIMRPDFHYTQPHAEDVESCLSFGNSVCLVIDVGIVSNHAGAKQSAAEIMKCLAWSSVPRMMTPEFPLME